MSFIKSVFAIAFKLLAAAALLGFAAYGLLTIVAYCVMH